MRGIKQRDIRRFKDRIRIGDSVIMTEQDPMDISVTRQFRYTVVEKHKHTFTAQRTDRRGNVVTVGMAYIKLMVEGAKAMPRGFPK